MSEYKYYIGLSGAANFIEVHPYNTHDYKFKITREDDSFIYRKRLESDVLLINKASEGITDYTILKEIADGNHPSVTIHDKNIFRITEIKDGEETIYEGNFKVTDCYFNVERQQVTFKSVVKDEYSEFFENGDTDINILEVGSTSITISIKSWLEFSYLATNGDPELPDGDEWSLYYTEDPIAEGRPSGGKLYVYARERIVVPRDTTMSGWTEIEYEANEISKTYVRDYSTTYTAPNDSQFTYTTCDADPPSGDWYMIKPAEKTTLRSGAVTCRMYARWVHEDIYNGGEYIVDIEHESCRPLKLVIEYIISQVAPSFTGEVKSRILFNDQYASDYIMQSYNNKNYVTNQDPNPLNELYLIEKSDFIKPNASQPATIGNITFNNLMDELKKLFAGNVYWKIDVDGNFRIEYVYYFQALVGLNLTEDKYSKYQQADNNFEYKTDELYDRESWAFNESGSEDFTQSLIDYEATIAINGNKENKKEYSINILNTDVDYLNKNINEISDNGFVLICAEEDGTDLICKTAVGWRSGESVQNGDISLANLIYYYGKYNRSNSSYILDGISQSGWIKKIKRQIPIEFVTGDDIDFTKMIQTSMGNGEIEEAEVDLLKKYKVTLLYGD